MKVNFFIKLILAVGFLLPLLTPAQDHKIREIYNILDYGAVNHIDSNSQAAIQRTIDACAKDGGGRVLIPSGTFSTATLIIKDNIDIHLANGAKLYAIPDEHLYNNSKEGLEDAGDVWIPTLILAKKVKNISISGGGSIIGQPRFYTKEIKEDDNYPGWNANAKKSGVSMLKPFVEDPKISLVYISDCENVSLKDFHIINSPNWSCHLQWSRFVNVNGVKISSSLKTGVNSDGLDIDGCKSVTVQNCVIETGDDAICIKTTNQGNRSETSEDITINNCVLSSTSCALKIGTETYSDIKRIMFSNCIIKESNRGIGIIVRDGAHVDQISYSNILLQCQRKPFYWWGNGEAFHLNVIKRNKSSKLGQISNVFFRGVSGNVEGTSAIIGSEEDESKIRNISIADMHVMVHPESEGDKRFTHGVEIEYAEGIDFLNSSIFFSRSLEKGHYSMSLAHVKGFALDNCKLKINGNQALGSAIRLHDVSKGYIKERGKNSYKHY